jgi:diacylglycerol kinase (ATP)
MNGLIAAYKGKIAGTLGLLPTGSASDFMGNVGVAKNLEEACHRLGKNQTRLVDLAVLRLPGEKIRYFDNQLGIGFDAVVTIEAQKFRRLRGMALYFPVVLKTVFLTNKATRVTIEADGQKMELPTMQISVANGSREGGGFYLAPEAKLDDGYLDLCVVRQISKLTMLRMIPTFMKGTHIKHKATTMLRARKVTITSEDDLMPISTVKSSVPTGTGSMLKSSPGGSGLYFKYSCSFLIQSLIRKKKRQPAGCLFLSDFKLIFNTFRHREALPAFEVCPLRDSRKP